MNTGTPSKSPEKPAVALIAGPTASGKSALALAIAERTGGVIVNADASQVYADLRILTARPAPEEEARAEHRLFGHVDGATACSAADWAEEARAVVAQVTAAGRLPILVGGTGLYIRTLLDGIAPIPDIDPDIRAFVRALPLPEARALLEAADPEAAARLNPNDTTRTQRALEVVRATGRTLAAWQADRGGGIGGQIDLRPIVITPPRDLLYARCDARVGQMIETGAVEEVAQLRARHLDPALPVMRAIGVRPIMAHLDGTLTLSEAADQIRAETRKYAKRQVTWSRHQFNAAWPRYEDIEEALTAFFQNPLTISGHG
ncbi:tRNA (adenosine(37)-N6)-dimethylallyltransferase MiaA [Sphingomonas sp. ID0503]|uniref:tRNA (adenosine(37)-N6)-dimethylallyltransferase MiaA n=1 Tax=Sphingomonas sp. ID0503 TaxID=3399691 RepID=UPI003AFB2615